MKLPASWSYEQDLWRQGYKLVAGVDEVGRGAWAGPVVTAAVIFPPNLHFPEKLFDSKMLDARQRETLARLIRRKAFCYSFGVIDVSVINKFGIGEATQKAFRQCLSKLNEAADFILIDAFYVKAIKKAKQLPLKHGDSLCASIAAASILAKVYRDELLVNLHQHYPVYGFDRHKGYGTKFHQEAILTHSLSSVHRLSFNLSPYLAASV